MIGGARVSASTLIWRSSLGLSARPPSWTLCRLESTPMFSCEPQHPPQGLRFFAILSSGWVAGRQVYWRGAFRPRVLHARFHVSRLVAKRPAKSASGSEDQSHSSPSSSPSSSRLQLPHFHRPSKEELLAAANGFLQRLNIRWKWLLLRQNRPFNADDISGLFSWFLVGHVLWIVLGTTTFFSLALLAANTVFAQETLARIIGNYLTKETGINVTFESAIVPKWKDGTISFKNVFVSRRPSDGRRTAGVRKGSSVVAAAAAAAKGKGQHVEDLAQDADNFTEFDITLETIDVTLSFRKWMNGKGLLRDVDIKGVRGVVDRRRVVWPADADPRSFKHPHSPGDFELDSLKLEDLLLTVYQPHEFRPYSVSLFSCDLPQLRKYNLFYDFLCANHVSGAFDDSLFTIHPRQLHGTNQDESSPWKRVARVRFDGVNIDHLNRGVNGPFGWITRGTVDLVADIMIPTDDENLNFKQLLQGMVERVEQSVGRNRTPADGQDSVTDHREDHTFLVFDLRVQLNDIKAAVPLFNRELSYVNNALVRPIVGYMNNRRTYIPLTCRLVKRVSDFDGSWTPFDSGLMEDLSAEVYEAFAANVVDEQMRHRRIKKVGLWSLHLLGQMFLMFLPTVGV